MTKIELLLLRLAAFAIGAAIAVAATAHGA